MLLSLPQWSHIKRVPTNLLKIFLQLNSSSDYLELGSRSGKDAKRFDIVHRSIVIACELNNEYS